MRYVHCTRDKPLQEVRRAELKQHVSWATMALGPVMAVVPGGEPIRDELDKVLVQLETLRPYNPKKVWSASYPRMCRVCCKLCELRQTW